MHQNHKVHLNLLALATGGLLLLLSFGNVQAQTPHSATISLSITAPRQEISANTRCDIAIKVTNTSSAIIMLRVNNDAIDDGKDWDFKVVDKSSGVALKLKASFTHPPFSIYTQHGSFQFERLKPGESLTRIIDISKLFDLPPGTYQVQVNRHLPKAYGGATVSSNKVSVAIAP